jgi:lysophospholipase L1-like esterase
MLRKTMGPIVAACLVLVACNDASAPLPTGPTIGRNEAEGRGFAQRLYAIGTSISAGTCSDGNIASCQNMSYVAQLVRAMHREPTIPFIGGTGCKSPFASPIISFKRVSGESVTLPEASLSCAPNEPGVVLPTQMLGVPGALTGDALVMTPENKPDAYGAKLYSRILPPGESQVSAFEKAEPKFAVIELGPNDILGVHSGAVVPGVTYVPFSVWSQQYNAVLDRVTAVTKQGLLIGLGRDIAKLPSLRRGGEFWQDRAAFLSAFNVEVSADCDGSTNLLVVPIIVPSAVGAGLTRRAAGAGPHVLSCAGGAANVQDRVLTPAEVATVNNQLVQMSDHIRAQAAARGYAFVELEVLYGIAKPPFSVVSVMTSGTPYGPNISLDGLHPAAAGHTIIANAALQAIDERYALGINGVAPGNSTSPSAGHP